MPTTGKKQTGKGGKAGRVKVSRLLNSKVFIGTFMTLALFAVLALITFQIPFLPREFRYSIGDASISIYHAPRTVTYVDTLATDEAREASAAAIQDIYTIDSSKNAIVFDLLGDFFREVERGRRALVDFEKGADLGDVYGVMPTRNVIIKDTLSTLESLTASAGGMLKYEGPDLSIWITAGEADYWRLRQLLEQKLREELTGTPIKIGDLDARKEEFKKKVTPEQDLTASEAELLGNLGAAYMRANAVLDELRTQQARGDARATVLPIYGTVEKGDLYLKAGERVTQTVKDIWLALGIITQAGEPKRSMIATWVAVMLLAIVFLVMLLYLYRFYWQVVQSMKTFGLFLLVNFATGASGILIGLMMSETGGVQIHLVSVAVILNALLICIYFTNNLGMFNSIIWAGLLAAYFSPAIFLPAALCASLTCLLLRHDPTRIMLALLVLLNALVFFFTLAALELFAGGEVLQAFKIPHLIVALLVGAIPVAAVFFLNMLIDLAFNLPTASRLNEFANLNHPLLRRLQLEAPGTYHHSIMVGSIAELAGGEIGANPLLIRVGALYHDIGKGQRSEFFAENQVKGSNIHSKYSPSLSKIIIENHVRDGVRLAKRARLPQEIIDIIPQHHGTTLITYFFRKALAMSNGDPVNEHDFRYPGPKPQTPEAAVLLMTDASESAARALEEPTPHRITTAVDRIFEERLLDGQFNECGLTIDQLERMRESIISSLTAAYHHRLAYPDEDEMKREMEKEEKGAVER